MNIQVQDLVCSFCKHIIRAEPNVIEQYRKEFEAGTKFCEVCCDKTGKRKFGLRTWKCGSCTQVQDDRSAHLCFCKDSSNIIKIVYDPHDKWMRDRNESLLDKQRKEEINLAKTQRLYKEKLAKARQEPIDRQKEIVDLLKLIAYSVDEKEEPESKVKEINHSAIL